ncbi:MAG TPA: ABC transporter permease [bacterium]|nr:ABC transporter permease [bacterium]
MPQVTRYVLRRLLLLPPLLVGVSLLLFVLTHLVPADPAKLIAGEHAGPEQLAAVRHTFGLDRPLPQQYLVFLARLARGDLGTSMLTNGPVMGDLAQYFPATVELAASAMLLTIVLGIPIGVLSAVRRGGMTDLLAQVLSLSGLSFPVFFFGILLQLVFVRWLGWLPLSGRLGITAVPPPHITGLYVVDSLLTGKFQDLGSALSHLVLPALTLALSSLAPTVRMTRSTMLESLSQDYTRTAWAKGIAPLGVLVHHALRNALIPVITVLGLYTGGLLGGVFLVELVFTWPGVGLYSVNAITALDYPGIMGASLLLTVVFVLVNLGVDVLYAVVDPRIRY